MKVHITWIELKQWYVWFSFVLSYLVQDESSQKFQRICKQILLWNTKKVARKELKHDEVHALTYTILILKDSDDNAFTKILHHHIITQLD